MNLVVWGVGQGYIKNKYLLCNLKYKLVDKSTERQGRYIDDILVESPEILHKFQYDLIVISTPKYFKEIYEELVIHYFVPNKKIVLLDRDIEKEILMRNIGKYKLKNDNNIRILFGYCFLKYENCRIHDYLLAESLRIRGAKIIPLVCDGIQELQCSVFGGMWGNNTNDISTKISNHKHNCSVCKKYDNKVWGEWGESYKILSASEFLTDDDKAFTSEFIKKLDISLIEDWKYKYFHIGEWALRTYFNNEMISYKDSWKINEEKEIRSLTYNVMLMCIVSLKAVESVKPEIIYSNDSFYYPYSILESIAKDKKIPFYNAYGFRKNTYTYALNTPSVNMDLDSAWNSFSKQKLSNNEDIFITNYIKNRRYGQDMMLNTADPFKSVKIIKKSSIHGTINYNKKTALIATNVSWDAAALNKGIVWNKIIDWVLYTIEFFAGKQEWQLIVRTHPAEINKLIPETRERICSSILKKYNYQLPSNIILLDGDAPVVIYELFNLVNFGIVYTTTVGLEMCCSGIPTITVAKAPYRGKGFTYDPINIKEYRECLELLMNVKLSDQKLKKMIEQAKKFLLLYYFIYMIPNSFYDFSYEEGAKMKIKSVEGLLPGKNLMWDYICESILKKKAILSEDRIPPYKLEV